MLGLLIAVLLIGLLSTLARLRLAGWTGLLVGLGVLGGAPEDPTAAVVSGGAACVAARILIRATRARLQRPRI
jgi:hypothetical protein